jgi:hypothetical protein
VPLHAVVASASPNRCHTYGTLLWKGSQMISAEPCRFTQDREAQYLDPRSQLPNMPTEAMVRQAEVDSAYLAVEAARADPIYQAELQAKAAEARDRAHRLRAAMAQAMCGKD